MSGSCVASQEAGYPIVNAAIASCLGLDYPMPTLFDKITIRTYVKSFLVKK